MDLPTTVSGVIDRLREIDDELPADDRVAIFNRMYRTVSSASLRSSPTPHRRPDHVSRI